MSRWMLFLSAGMVWSAEFSREDFLHGLGELVGAGRAFSAAVDAFEFVDDLLRGHAFHKDADGSEIAGAAARERHVGDDAVVNVDVDLGRADELAGLVGVVHGGDPFLIEVLYTNIAQKTVLSNFFPLSRGIMHNFP